MRHPWRYLRAALHAALNTALRRTHTTPCECRDYCQRKESGAAACHVSRACRARRAASSPRHATAYHVHKYTMVLLLFGYSLSKSAIINFLLIHVLFENVSIFKKL